MDIIDAVDELYPTVGLQTTNAMVDVNFGQMPFLYDIYKDIQVSGDCNSIISI